MGNRLRGWAPLLVVGLELAVRTPLGRTWPLRLALVVRPWWAAVLLPYGLWMLWRRQRRAVLLAALLGIVWLLQYGGRWFPRPAAGNPHLRVLTWNVWAYTTDPAPLLAVIEREQPDIILLQEVDVGLRNPLLAALAADYPYAVARQPTGPDTQPDDLALLSRLPFQAANLDCAYHTCYRRVFTLGWQGRTLNLVNVHVQRSSQPTWLGLPTDFVTTNEERIARELATLPLTGPTLLAGDFNLSEWQPGYTRLRSRWHDSWPEAGRGMGFTWPQTLLLPALVRIDYVWHSAELVAVAAHTGGGPSDHRYLVVDLAMAQAR